VFGYFLYQPWLSIGRCIFVSFLVVIGSVFVPCVVFSGYRKNEVCDVLSVLAKIFLTGGIFIFVSGQKTTFMWPLFNGDGYVVVCCASVVFGSLSYGVCL